MTTASVSWKKAHGAKGQAASWFPTVDRWASVVHGTMSHQYMVNGGLGAEGISGTPYLEVSNPGSQGSSEHTDALNQTGQPESCPHGMERELTPASGPLTSKHTLWGVVHTHTQLYIHRYTQTHTMGWRFIHTQLYIHGYILNK